MTWTECFMKLCEAAASKSKDPSTRVGSVIVRPDNTVASTGWNGLPRGVLDLPERYADRAVKCRFVCHAEANAIVSAREPLHGYTLYASMAPCHECAKLIIQAGIARVVTPAPSAVHVSRWAESFDATDAMFSEAGVEAWYANNL